MTMEYKKIIEDLMQLEGLLREAISRGEDEMLAQLVARKAEGVIEALGSLVSVSESPAESPESPESAEADVEVVKTDVGEDIFYSIEEEGDSEDATSAMEPTPAVAHEAERVGKGHISFSLNDKFLFIRTLFKDSPKTFGKAMHLVEAASSYDEAERILVNEFHFDPEREIVQDFLSQVKNAF